MPGNERRLAGPPGRNAARPVLLRRFQKQRLLKTMQRGLVAGKTLEEVMRELDNS
jgi:hypothetical protein